MVKSKLEAKSAKWSKDQHLFWQKSFPESYCQMFWLKSMYNVHCTRRNDVFEIISSSGIPSHLALQKLRSKSNSFQSRFNLSLCNSSDGSSRVSAFIWNRMHLSGKQRKLTQIWNMIKFISPQILMALHLSWVAAHQCLKGRGPIPIQSLTLQIMG